MKEIAGYGVFETMRSYRGKIIYLDAHLERLKNSSAWLGLRLPHSTGELKKIIAGKVEEGGFRDAHIRLTLWKKAHSALVSVEVKEYHPYPLKKYRQGFKVCIAPYRQNEGSMLTQLKSTNRLLYELAYNFAKSKGLDEAVILNSRGNITEGSRSNIFLVKGKELFTPGLDCGCLPGITRRAVWDLAKKYHIGVYEGAFTMRDFADSDEVFLTNSLMGIMPVNRCGKLTLFLSKKYHCLLS